jgi:hypothetical protein
LSPPAEAVVHLVLAPARGWAALVGVVHAAAMIAALAWMPVAAGVMVALGLAVSGALGVRTALLRGRQAVRAVDLRADGSAAWIDGEGEWRSATVEGAASLGHRFTALRLRAGRDRRSVVLVPGAVDAAAFRRARVWARWRGPNA